MRSRVLVRASNVGIGLVTAAFFSFGGISSAQASISNTGPDSTNTISSSNTNTCTVTNTNNVSLNNANSQNAQSGDVTVDGNTNAGSGWGAWDPVTWQNKGYSYEQWHSAFMTYMASQAGNWSSNWGHMAGGGSAQSGNATNNNSTSIGLSINNGGAGSVCLGSAAHVVEHPTPTPAVLGDSSSAKAPKTVRGVLGASNGAMTTATTMGGGAGQSAPMTMPHTMPVPMGSGGGTVYVPVPVMHDPVFTISNTGPDSKNSITSSDRTTTTVTNTNTINIANTNNQTANSGDVNVSGNTSAGTAGSGGASNGNGTSTGVGLGN